MMQLLSMPDDRRKQQIAGMSLRAHGQLLRSLCRVLVAALRTDVEIGWHEIEDERPAFPRAEPYSTEDLDGVVHWYITRHAASNRVAWATVVMLARDASAVWWQRRRTVHNAIHVIDWIDRFVPMNARPVDSGLSGIRY